MIEWFEVKEKLPEVNEKVWAKSEGNFVKESVFFIREGKPLFFVEPCFEIMDVTHWLSMIEDNKFV